MLISVFQLLLLSTISKTQDSKSRFVVSVGHRAAENTGGEVVLDDEMKCAKKCHESQNCTGFNYAKRNETCQLVTNGPAFPLTIADPQWNYAAKCGRRSLNATVVALVQTSPEFNWRWCDGVGDSRGTASCEWVVTLRFLPCGSTTDRKANEPGDSMAFGKNEFNLNYTLPEHWSHNQPMHKDIYGLPTNQCIYFLIWEDDPPLRSHGQSDHHFCDGQMEITQTEVGRVVYEGECNTTTPGIPLRDPRLYFNATNAALKVGIEVDLSNANC